jgi:hypothetical protein
MKELNDVRSEIMAFGEIFASTAKLGVPGFQREYRWAPRQVKAFVEDATKTSSQAWFYGTVILSGELEGSEFHIVDGQQRLTTALLMLAAVRDHLAEVGGFEETVRAINRHLRTASEDGSIVFHRLNSQHAGANATIQDIILGREPGAAANSMPGSNYTLAYSAAVEELERLGVAGEKAADFAARFLRRAGVAVLVARPADAVSMFTKQHETLSPLGVADRMKGALFATTGIAEQRDLVDAFHKVQAILWSLEGDRTLIHVLRGMAESADQARPEPVVAAAVERARKVGAAAFTKGELLPAARALGAALEGKHPSGEVCQPLLDIVRVQRLSRFTGVRPLMVAARTLSDEDRTRLFDQLRRTLTVLFIAQSAPPSNEREFRSWADRVLEGDVDGTIGAMRRHAKMHADAFAAHFQALSILTLGSTGVRYLFGLIEGEIRREFGEDVAASAVERFPADSFDVEHILPQSPGAWGDVSDAALRVDLLGNLTMLESTRNRSIKDAAYQTKLSEYGLSGSYLTRSMHSGLRGAGKDNRAARAAKMLREFPSWDADTIGVRSQLLYTLLCGALGVEVKALPSLPTSDVPDGGVDVKLPQARPLNTLRVLRLVGQGLSEEADVAARIVGRGEVGADPRQASYCLATLEFAGLAESDDGVYTLTDAGAELYGMLDAASDGEQLDRLRGVLERALTALPGGEALVRACRLSEGHEAAVLSAAKAMSPDLSDSTLRHRARALRAWFFDAAPDLPGNDLSGQDLSENDLSGGLLPEDALEGAGSDQDLREVACA